MADPVIIDCPAGAWTPVAIKVTTGIVHNKLRGPMYLQTYRDNGETAPTLQSEGVQIFVNSDTAIISAVANIDVYIMAVGKAGKVRVDLPGE